MFKKEKKIYFSKKITTLLNEAKKGITIKEVSQHYKYSYCYRVLNKLINIELIKINKKTKIYKITERGRKILKMYYDK